MAYPRRWQVYNRILEDITPHAEHPRLKVPVADLVIVAPHFRTAIRSLMDGRRGIPKGQSFGPSSSSNRHDPDPIDEDEPPTGHHDPAGDAGVGADPVGAQIHNLDAALTRLLRHAADPLAHPKAIGWITHDALTVRATVAAWTPHLPTAKDRREVQAVNQAATECTLTRSELGCFDEVYCVSDLYGMLPEPVAVGRWVHRFAKDRRRLPTPQEWRAHGSKDDDLRKQLARIGAGR